MTGTTRLLVWLAVVAIAVPVVPWLAWGARLDHAVADWLNPPPEPPVVAVAEIAVLAADILLPVPSSFVATLGGASLGVAVGTACAWIGMTIGAMAGWWLGRVAGGRRVAALDPADRDLLESRERRFGPLAVVLTRPLPILAEAASLLAGAAGMPWRSFLPAAAAGNLAIAFVWSLAGALGRDADSLQWAAMSSLVVPSAVVWVIGRRRLSRSATSV